MFFFIFAVSSPASCVWCVFSFFQLRRLLSHVIDYAALDFVFVCVLLTLAAGIISVFFLSCLCVGASVFSLFSLFCVG